MKEKGVPPRIEFQLEHQIQKDRVSEMKKWARFLKRAREEHREINLAIVAPTVYAETAYQSGVKHGVADATADKAPDCNDPKVSHPKCKDDYIDQPGKGFFFQSKQFINGYLKGWCSVIGPNAGTERVTAIFDCDKDPTSASWATNSKGQDPISGGIVIEASGVPPGAINLLY